MQQECVKKLNKKRQMSVGDEQIVNANAEGDVNESRDAENMKGVTLSS